LSCSAFKELHRLTVDFGTKPAHVPVCCSVLRCVAVSCNVCCSELQQWFQRALPLHRYICVLQFVDVCVTVSCSGFENPCVAVWIAASCSGFKELCHLTVPFVTNPADVMCVAVCCSVCCSLAVQCCAVQCGAVWCSVLGVVCCSVLYYTVAFYLQ